GVLSVSVMAGFPYADVPEMGASVIAVADGDPGLAADTAAELAVPMFAGRRGTGGACPRPGGGGERGLRAERGPVVLVDLGDNVGGGTPGDSTVLLAELMKQGATGALMTLFAPEAARAATEIGAGGAFECEVGGPPVRVRGRVRSLHDGQW